MAFTYFVLEAMERKYPQILLPSISLHDFLGTGKRVGFGAIFDVAHWNTHYPALPRLVRFDPKLHEEWVTWRMALTWLMGYNSFWNPADGLTKPYAFGSTTDLLNAYKSYTSGIDDKRVERDPAELLILSGALRPHPELQSLLDHLTSNMIGQTTNETSRHKPSGYMALHARVEPDMQSSVFCRWAKVKNLSTIFELLERDIPEPPAPILFIAVNRKLLERYGSDLRSDNVIAVENLRALNRATAQGLWNGTVQVFEAGQGALNGTRFSSRPGVFGAAVDYFLAVDAILFVGTEISSFSMDIISTRFYRGNKANNYLYLPGGIKAATPDGVDIPPRFNC
jgi:hypothetical protein